MLESILFAIFIWSLIILKIIFRSTPQETQTNNFTQTNNHTHINNNNHINSDTHNNNHKINETTNSTPIDQSPKEKNKYDSTSTFHYSAYKNIYCCSEYYNSQENSGRSSVTQEILRHAPKEPSQPENIFPYSPFDHTGERMEKEKIEKEKLRKENLEILKREQQKEMEYMKQLKRETQERERIEKLEKDRKEREYRESLERQRLKKERLEKEIKEAKEKQRVEREKKEKEKKEREQKKREEKERKQKEREENERKQKEREELERIQSVYKETLERVMERVRLENLERQEREEREEREKEQQQREQHEREEREKQEREQQQREQQEREVAERRENEHQCTICMDKIEPSKLATIDCNHNYCYDCIMEWSYRRDNTCPNCRAPFFLVRFNYNSLSRYYQVLSLQCNNVLCLMSVIGHSVYNSFSYSLFIILSFSALSGFFSSVQPCSIFNVNNKAYI
ncbi:hypothetical protein DICPUDRAFT_82806 [Dictyostelium purpureum]|uniref:RING-type domain-containing protein n=1 Tax=Dictyostelium purpureum TaxID=5786 RepID=F0ZXN5_DICPU|nr:uncharacterized protein DICPUDRAFT_82806 [Dictyostelium purpureum]EGC31296.1 hypothetical protein DICPUDRAFT_82806 [Dictyostelium purpureum]|eukprot:XP_003292173.1 hypothetical protein DICPUDRAFT_82806 [Dictyostelium purpureum]